VNDLLKETCWTRVRLPAPPPYFLSMIEKTVKVGDRVNFDYMGREHTGTVLEIMTSTIGTHTHKIVRVKADKHMLDVSINVTLFPSRVRSTE